MARSTRASWAPVVRPAVVVVLMIGLAILVRGSVWMTAALVVGLIAFAFVLIALLGRIPTRRD